MSKKKSPTDLAFVDGYLAACQTLYLAHGEYHLAESLLAESGFSRTELLAAQKRAGYQDEKMNPLIRSACRS